MKKSYSLAAFFGEELAELLSAKLQLVYPSFDSRGFQKSIAKQLNDKSYTQRVSLFADELKRFLPEDYKQSVKLLIAIMGEENPNETGMFTNYYWLLPAGKFIETYGLEHFELSINAISELTKRNTGEYAIRPFIRKYPEKSLKQMKAWAKSDNFHLRRLASEGLRPKLPWSTKLDTFLSKPEVVFEILEILKADEVKFVKKSVANHLTDWLKVNYSPTASLIKKWRQTDNPHTLWILKHATRKIAV